jgi:hypothetical protein
MPKAFDKWQVFGHRPIEKLEHNLWRIEGDLPAGNGTRVMTIVKMKGGGLVIHNGVALERIIVSHGKPMIDKPSDVLKTVAARL